MKHFSQAEINSKLKYILNSPKNEGHLKMIVRRPDIDAREVLEEGILNKEEGLSGDSWNKRPSSRTADHSPHPGMQLNIMNSRVIETLAGDRSRWNLAGDQLFIDMDLSVENLPSGSRLSLGKAIIEVSPEPHTGCQKFKARFGRDAHLFVNSELGKIHRFRGLNARVIKNGIINTGDLIKKIK